MKKLLFLAILIPILFFDNGCKDNSTEPNDTDTTSAHVRKPNLYIYPNNNISLFVEIDFPKGGDIVESIPEYNDFWSIEVEPTGKINNDYDYLYYECDVPSFEQKEYGWIIKQDNLKIFFDDNLKQSGFNEKEKNDFLEYWIPELVNYKYYEIYPQYIATLDKVIKINFSIEPNNFYRLCYLIIGRDDNNLKLKEPEIESATRLDYFAVEWGVILR